MMCTANPLNILYHCVRFVHILFITVQIMLTTPYLSPMCQFLKEPLSLLMIRTGQDKMKIWKKDIIKIRGLYLFRVWNHVINYITHTYKYCGENIDFHQFLFKYIIVFDIIYPIKLASVSTVQKAITCQFVLILLKKSWVQNFKRGFGVPVNGCYGFFYTYISSFQCSFLSVSYTIIK